MCDDRSIVNALINRDSSSTPKPNSRFNGWSLQDRDPQYIRGLMPILNWFYDYYFRVQMSGWEHLPASGKMLLVGSHNGGLAAPDMFMGLSAWCRRFGTERLLYGLMHPKVWQVSPEIAAQAVRCGAVIAHPRMGMAALRREAAVLVYPGGAEDVFRPYELRDQIYLAGRKGFIKLALREEAPIIPIISWGAHDTLIVLADVYHWVKQLHHWGMPWLFNIDPEVFPIYLGLPWGVGIGPLPNIPFPTQIHLRICPAIQFERYGRDVANDRDYVDACYEQVRVAMQQELDDLVGRVKT